MVFSGLEWSSVIFSGLQWSSVVFSSCIVCQLPRLRQLTCPLFSRDYMHKTRCVVKSAHTTGGITHTTLCVSKARAITDTGDTHENRKHNTGGHAHSLRSTPIHRKPSLQKFNNCARHARSQTTDSTDHHEGQLLAADVESYAFASLSSDHQ